MSKHCWYRPQNLGTSTVQCMKCGIRRPIELVVYAKARTPLGVQKKECPGLSGSFRRAMRRYLRRGTMAIQFNDGMKIETDGPMRVIRKSDGLYVVGHGTLCAVDSYEEGRQMIDEDNKRRVNHGKGDNDQAVTGEAGK